MHGNSATYTTCHGRDGDLDSRDGDLDSRDGEGSDGDLDGDDRCSYCFGG